MSDGTAVMKIACQTVFWDRVRNPEIIHYDGGFSNGYDLGTKYVIIKVSGLIFESNANIDIFNKNLDAWLIIRPIIIKIQRKSTGEFEKFDGINTTLRVLNPKGSTGITKLSKGDQEIYMINKMMFEQAGLLSA